MRRAGLVAAWAASPAVALAQAVAASPPEKMDGPPSLLASLIQLLLVLGIVVGLVYITLNFGLRRMMGVRPPGQSNALVSVVDRVVLDAKRTLFVVKAGSEYLLVGGGEGSLTLLTKLDPAEVTRMQAERGAGPTLSPFLMKLLSRRGGPPPPTA